MNRKMRGISLIGAMTALVSGLFGGVDLIVDSINVTTDPLVPGDVVPVSVTVTNIGDTDLAAGNGVIVRMTSALTNAAAVLSSPYSSGIVAGESATLDLSFTIADGDANNSYDLSFEVDPAEVIVEDNDQSVGTNNNGPTMLGTVSVEAYANLTPDAVDLGTGPFYPGSDIAIEVEYSNSGDRSTAGFSISATLITPAGGTSSSVTLAVPGMVASGADIATLTLPIPLDNPNGNYTVRVTVDSLSNIDENDGEGDNFTDTTFTIDTKPDLEITDLVYETGVWEAGDIIQFGLSYQDKPTYGTARTLRVENNATGRYQIEVVLSTDDVFGNEDDFLLYLERFQGNPVTGGNLLPNDPARPDFVGPQEIDLAWAQALPANLYGDFFVLAKIDVLEEQDEYVETDNFDNGNNVWYSTETAKITLVPSESPQAVTYRASVQSDGSEGTGMSEKPALSYDGRYVVFSSLSALVAEDTDSYFDVYRRDNYTGEVELVSAPLAIPSLSDGDSQYPTVSGDGRYVVYQSAAANLVGGDNNGQVDIFMTDMVTGTTMVVSHDTAGGFANGGSARPSVSRDGDVIVYQSLASDLVGAPPATGTLAVYAYDVSADTTTLLSGAAADGDSFEPKVSADGAFAVFTSEATNLAGGSAVQQVYRVATDGSGILLVSEDGSGTAGDAYSFAPSISEDGSVVAYATHATNIDIPGGWVDQDLPEIIVADIAGAVVTPTRLVTAAGAQFDGLNSESAPPVGALDPVLSADGSRVLFRTQASNILPTTKVRSDGATYDEGVDGVAVGYTDLNTYNTGQVTVSDLYLFDRDTGEYQIASLNTFGFQGAALTFSVNGGEALPNVPSSRDGVLSGDGRYVAFSSDGRGYAGFSHQRTNRLSDDGNEVRDVFIRDLRTGDEPVVTNPPVVSVSSPADGISVVEGALVPIAITATDTAPGYIETVYITVNGAVVATLTEPQYQYAWVPDLPGLYEVGAIAVDSDGQTAVAQAISVTVNETNAPTVSISYPANNSQGWPGQNFTISAQAQDLDGNVTQVEFFVNGSSIGVDTTAPYQLAWSPTGVGLYDIVAVATDNTGKLGYSSANRITIVDATAPTVSWIGPVDGSTVTAGQSLDFEVQVTGSSATISSVEILVNGNSVGFASEVTGIWTLAYTPTTVGQLAVEAIVTDSTGNLYPSSVLGLTVAAGNAPAASLIAPDPTDGDLNGIADGLLDLNVPVDLVVSASDADGTVESVDFYANGTYLGRGAEITVLGEYEIEFTPTQIGIVRITAVATDDAGNTTTAEGVYRVTAGSPPVVTIVSPSPVDGDLNGVADEEILFGEPASLRFSATDGDGTIERFEVYLNGALFTTNPNQVSLGVYEVFYNPFTTGLLEMEVVVQDNAGNISSTSTIFNVTNGFAPVVTLDSPDPADGNADGIADGALPFGSLVSFEWTISDVDDQVESILVYFDGALQQNFTVRDLGNDKYAFETTMANLGFFRLDLEIRDTAGNLTMVGYTFPVVSGLSVPTITRMGPDVSPADGTPDDTLLIGGDYEFVVEVTDPDGVSSVQISVNEGPDTAQVVGANLWAATLSPRRIDDMKVVVTAVDGLGNSTTTEYIYDIVSGAVPTVEIVSPGDGTQFLPGTSVPIVINAYDADGLISRVDVFMNGVPRLLGVQEPFRTALLVPTEGSYNLMARAYDNSGNAVDSAEVTIVVGSYNPEIPRVIMTHPTTIGGGDAFNDMSIASESWINTEVSVGPNDTIEQVEFLINGQSWAIWTSADPGNVLRVGNEFATRFNLNTEGSYYFTAKVTDDDGDIGEAAALFLDVGQLNAKMPTIRVRPVIARSPVREPVQLFAEADGSLIGINRVDFFANGVWVGSTDAPISQEATAGLYSLTWYPELPGDYDISAQAVQIDPAGGGSFDNWRLSSTSASIQVTPAPTSAQPSVSVVYPEEGQTFAVDSRVLIQAGATDTDGTISQVEFFVEDNYLDTPVESFVDATAPFTFEWTPKAQGEYRITAFAVDNSGDYNRSATRTVYVVSASGQPPSVSIIQPSPLSGLSVGVPYMLTARVANSQHPVQSVQFFSNGNLMGDATQSTEPDSAGLYLLPWTPALVGTYNVSAVVRDVRGNETYTVEAFTVADIDPADRPTVALINPAGGSSIPVSVPMSIQASASGGLGTISKVEFFANGVLLGTDTTYPYNVSYTPTALGTLDLVARATTTAGITGTSATNSVTVQGFGVTTIDIQEPQTGDTFFVGSRVPLIANVQTNGAGVDLRVDYYVNGELVGSTTDTPYRVFWDAITSGTFSISAIVTELSSGASASSSAEIVTVLPNPAPIFVGLAPVVANPTAGSDIQVVADVHDLGDPNDPNDDGFVTSVRFSVNGRDLGEDTSYPFTVFWRPEAAGTYTLEAEAVDNAGNISLFSAPVTIGNPVGQVPSLSLGLTASGNVTPGSRVVALANVFDDDPAGVSVTFFLNGTQVGEPDTEAPYSVIIEPSIGVPPNIYSVTGLATDSDGNSRAVTLSPLYISDVSVDQPSIEIVTPASGSTLTMGSRASLRASIVGPVENVAQVIFYANGVRIGTDNAAPYAIDWLPDQLGDVEITAAVLQNTVSYDHDNDSFTPLILVTPVMVANPVDVTVNGPVGVLPSVSFQVLPQKDNLAQGSQVILYADAQDIDGSIASVEFFLDGVSLGAADTTAPFSLLWTARREGEFYINAVATDNQGNVVNSNFEAVTVAPTVVSKTPTIDLVLPTTGLQAGSFLTLRSSVRDFVNGPDSVDFYIDGQPVGSVPQKPFNYVWEANLEGTVSVFATARYQLVSGAWVTTAADSQTMILVNDADPVITGFSVTWPDESPGKPNPLWKEPLTFTVDAEDNGRIERVELIRGGETVKSVDTNATTIELVDTPPAKGAWTYSVVVTDNAGRQTQTTEFSTPPHLAVNVVDGEPPTVAITTPTAGDHFLPSDTITVRAVASDPDGTVVGVQFSVDGLPYGDLDTTAPYELVFTPGYANSSLTLRAVAIDNSGNSSVPADIDVIVDDDNPPFFTNFSTNLTFGSGTNADPYIVRLGQEFTIFTEADDDNGLVSVRLLRNSTAVPAPGGFEVPTQFFDSLETPGIYTYVATATDSGNNVTSTSPRIFVKAVTGAAPLVSIQSPIDGTTVEASQSVSIQANVTPGDEGGLAPNGTISTVEFRANGTVFQTRTSPPYSAGFVPNSTGQFEISVRATSDTGQSAEAYITINAVDENLPDVLSFTNDAAGGQSLFGIPITFTVDARDEEGIRRIEFYRVGRAEPLGVALSEPYTFEYIPYPLDGGTDNDDRIDAGIHLYYARAVNLAGYTSDSETAEINIRYPRPLEEIEDFVFQAYLDLLLRVPTNEERNAAVGTFDPRELPAEQDAAISLVLNIMQSDDYVAVRSAMIAHFLYTGEWPDRHELESGVRLISEAAGGDFGALDNAGRATAVRELVELLLPALEAGFGSPLLASAQSPEQVAQVDALMVYLWDVKYGVPLANPSKQRQFYLALGREEFLSRFVMDVGNISLPSGNAYTPILGFANPPNDRVLEWSNAAAMYLNLLREQPDQGAVESLATELPATQVVSTFADPAYSARFAVADLQLIHLEQNWKDSSWFGHYWAEPNGWNYHLEMGWVWFEMQGQEPNSFWYYDQGTGWTWTNQKINPNIYSDKLGTWLYRIHTNFNKAGKVRWFYNYTDQTWHNY